MTAAANARLRGGKASKVRQFITPEGVDLELKIASSGLRLGALVVDLTLIMIALIAFLLLVSWAGFGSKSDISGNRSRRSFAYAT